MISATMKLEYVSDGSEDCPLIRIHGFGPPDACSLRSLAVALADGSTGAVEVHGLARMEPVDGCRLTLRVGPEDRGIRQLPAPNAFECVLRQRTWEQVADLIAPFCEEVAPGRYQWLDESGDIALLLSADGNW